MSPDAVNQHRIALGFRDGDRGTHSSRTIMLNDVELLFDATESDAVVADYRRVVVEENVLGKPTHITREHTVRKLKALYGLDPSIPVFRSFRMLWDLDKEVSCILSLLPEPVQASLASPSHKAFYNSCKLYYIPGKVFAVTKSGGNEASFYDLSQYFPDDPEPTGMQDLQQKADLLMTTLSEFGITSPTKLTSPVAVAEASGLLNVVERYHSDYL